MIEVNTRVIEQVFGRRGTVVEIDWPFGTPEETPWAEPHYSVQLDDHPWPESYGEKALRLEEAVDSGEEASVDLVTPEQLEAVNTADQE